MAGAWTVTVISPDFLRRALPVVLVGVLAYTLARKDLGRHHAPRFSGRQEAAAACLLGLTIGFYDGFFGPGTGSFFVFLFVRMLGFDFLHASAGAKLLNTATNLAALVLFASKGHVWGHLESGDTIHDLVRFITAPVNMIGTGWVGSAATHLYLAAPRERRFCLPNTRFLIHQPSGGAGGPASDIAIQAREMVKARERIAATIARQTGKPLEA
eukprot:gene1437-2014_t